MYRDFLTSKWVLGGFAFLIVFGVSCVFWYHYDTAPYKRDAAETAELMNQLKQSRNVQKEVKSTPVSPPIENRVDNINEEKQETTVDAVGKTEQSSLPKKKNAKVRMSPHGFGAYPQIPDGAPVAEFEETDSVNMELLGRVIVKAWNDGKRFEGAFIDGDTGKVYLNYSNVLYVEYSEDIDEETGEVTIEISSVTGAASTQEASRLVLDGYTPPGYTLIDITEVGINPYDYLDLH